VNGYGLVYGQLYSIVWSQYSGDETLRVNSLSGVQTSPFYTRVGAIRALSRPIEMIHSIEEGLEDWGKASR